MLKSMTGFGRSKLEANGREYTVEIKSVNHKYTDLSIKLPRTISYLEESVRKLVLSRIARGKVDVFITFHNTSEMGKTITLNKEIAKQYIQELTELAEGTGIIDDISIMEIAKLPEVLNISEGEEDERIEKELASTIVKAIDQLEETKKQEGNRLAKDMEERIQGISEKIEEISKNSTGLIQEYVVKLEERIKEILKDNIVDPNRLAQEVVIYSDKCSVQEEITRLRSHFVQFNSILQNKEYQTVGKTLDFLVQEMNRETNTIGSKANCLAITKLVVDVKTEIENIREQVQNIE